jgi:transcriptional regulator with PAS, ATPase and Fis domain
MAPADAARADSAVRARFQALVQSPLRAGLIRFLGARPHEAFDVESLMETFGRIRVDVTNCITALSNGGIVKSVGGHPERFQIVRPTNPDFARVLEDFLADRPGESAEDRSPSIQRFRELIGRDEKMMVVFEAIRTVSKTDLSVMVLGPTGSGKEVVARMIHELSNRRNGTFQAVNCAALPDALFESEVFGYERGAFTGAYDRKPGRIELANHGTLFLDEVGDLSLMAQAKLLRVTEERRVERLGSRTSLEVDFRLICATNRPLEALVTDGSFREDLYYRFNAFTIRLPALRERPADIPVLADRFLARFCAAQGLPLDGRRFAPDARDRLMHYSWPGNIRELETTVSRAALSARDGVVRAGDLQFLHLNASAPDPERQAFVPLRVMERDYILRVLNGLKWNKKRAAEVLQIGRETLYRKIAEYALEQERDA